MLEIKIEIVVFEIRQLNNRDTDTTYTRNQCFHLFHCNLFEILFLLLNDRDNVIQLITELDIKINLILKISYTRRSILNKTI